MSGMRVADVSLCSYYLSNVSANVLTEFFGPLKPPLSFEYLS
jgi:hypothetical protein